MVVMFFPMVTEASFFRPLTYKVNGLVNGDQLTGELKRVAGENVGSYAIEQNTLTAGNNYTITYTGANLTIIAKAITEADVKLNGSPLDHLEQLDCVGAALMNLPSLLARLPSVFVNESVE